jgi:Domain of unknown function (DUF4375)
MFNANYKISRLLAEGLDDYNLFWAVVEPMWDDLDFYEEPERAAAFFAAVSPAQGGMIAMWWCRSEVCNGGFDQFFSNSTGMIWHQALEGFRLVGAQSHAEHVERALSVFPGSIAPLDRNERIEALESNEDRINVLDPIDQAFFVLERNENENLDAICARYVRSNPSEFFRDCGS